NNSDIPASVKASTISWKSLSVRKPDYFEGKHQQWSCWKAPTSTRIAVMFSKVGSAFQVWEKFGKKGFVQRPKSPFPTIEGAASELQKLGLATTAKTEKEGIKKRIRSDSATITRLAKSKIPKAVVAAPPRKR